MKVRVVIDVEMCRVRTKSKKYPHKNEIIQIGAVMLNEAYEIVSRFSTYVKPRYGKIDYYIATLTGISERNVKNAPDIEAALSEILLWIGEYNVYFYSWSDTDYFQIRNEIEHKCHEDCKWERILDQSKWIDYQKVFGKRLESARLFKLTEALDLAELDTEGHFHDGFDDALNTARLMAKLEMHKNYRTLIERIRENEAKQIPLTSSLGNILQGLVLETA